MSLLHFGANAGLMRALLAFVAAFLSFATGFRFRALSVSTMSGEVFPVPTYVPDQTVGGLLAAVEAGLALGPPDEGQRHLVLGGAKLSTDKTLAEAGVGPDSELILVVSDVCSEGEFWDGVMMAWGVLGCMSCDDVGSRGCSEWCDDDTNTYCYRECMRKCPECGH